MKDEERRLRQGDLCLSSLPKVRTHFLGSVSPGKKSSATVWNIFTRVTDTLLPWNKLCGCSNKSCSCYLALLTDNKVKVAQGSSALESRHWWRTSEITPRPSKAIPALAARHLRASTDASATPTLTRRPPWEDFDRLRQTSSSVSPHKKSSRRL